MPNMNKLKFIVILRDPTQRTISSWVYKKSCKSCAETAPKLPSFQASIEQGMNQGDCISKCFKKQSSKYSYKELVSDYNLKLFTTDDDSGCSISRCRMKYDRTGGKTGGSPFMVKYITKHSQTSTSNYLTSLSIELGPCSEKHVRIPTSSLVM